MRSARKQQLGIWQINCHLREGSWQKLCFMETLGTETHAQFMCWPGFWHNVCFPRCGPPFKSEMRLFGAEDAFTIPSFLVSPRTSCFLGTNVRYLRVWGQHEKQGLEATAGSPSCISRCAALSWRFWEDEDISVISCGNLASDPTLLAGAPTPSLTPDFTLSPG